MPKGKADISNTAIRIFLQEVGRFYDEARGMEKFTGSKRQKKQILEFFNYECCFCGAKLTLETMSMDHLIPANKSVMGLHAWGNVVPACRECNSTKQQMNWELYLASVCTDKDFHRRYKMVENFVQKYAYNPNLQLSSVADNLYQDVGEVAMVLINLRYKQATEAITKIVKGKIEPSRNVNDDSGE